MNPSSSNEPCESYSNMSTPVSGTEASSSPNLLSTGSSLRNATLARQPSFDHGGEGRLSSTQVKQILKTYLLNRRKQPSGGAGSGRFRRGDDRFTMGSQLSASRGSDTSPNSVGQRGGGAFWDSNDSANSFDSDWNEAMTGDRCFQHSSYQENTDNSNEVCSITDTLLLQLAGILSRSGQFTANPTVLHQLLTYAKALSASNRSTAGQLRADLRKTISEPDLVETSCPWPLRLVSHLIHQTANSQMPGVSDREKPMTMNAGEYWHPSSTTCAMPRTHTPTAVHSHSHWSNQDHQVPATSLGVLNTSVSRSTLLEPLVEPPFHADPSCSLAERTIGPSDQRCPTPATSTVTRTGLNWRSFDCPAKHLGLRGPLQSSSSVDSAIPGQSKIRSQLSATGGSLQRDVHGSSRASVANPHEVAMDWESDGPTDRSSTEPVSQPSKDSFHLEASTRSTLFDLKEAQERIFELWCNLPVEDWSTSPAPSTGGVREFPPRLDSPSLLPTAIAFDPEMLHHKCLCTGAHDLSVHPESPMRMSLVFGHLIDSRIRIPPNLPFTSSDLASIVQASLNTESSELQRELHRYASLDQRFLHALLSCVPLIGFCRLIRARMATEDELRIFHSEDHIFSFGRTMSNKRLSTQIDSSPSPPSLELLGRSFGVGRRKSDTGAESTISPRLCKLPCGGLGVDSDTVWNPGATAKAARLAAGQVLCLAHKVAINELRNGFALVRPPGHHAEPDQAMGFCYFNSVAVAALHLLRNHLVSKLLILDWDIHHGNGTKLATLHPGLVYISIHRHDRGTFFPGTGAVQDSLTGSFSNHPHNQSHPDDGTMAHATAPSQLINIAWGAPVDGVDTFDDRYCRASGQQKQQSFGQDSKVCETEVSLASKQLFLEGIDAGDRRQMWRQHCTRRKHPYRADCRVLDSPSGDTSTGSFSGARDADPHPLCSCRLVGSGSSGASSQACSICMSHPSSFGSASVQSGGMHATAASASTFRRVDELPSQQPNSDLKDAHQSENSPLLGLSDAEYLAAVRCVVLPVANEFKPDIILISAGFDAARGHQKQLGGYSVSPGTFAWITRQCMSITNSRVVLALEGGYVPVVVSDCVTQCLNALLLPAPRTRWSPVLNEPHKRASRPNIDPEGYMDAWLSASDWIEHSELNRPPRPEAVSNIMATILHQAGLGWRCFANVSEENVAMSFSDAMKLERGLFESCMDSKSSMEPSAWNVELDAAVCNSPLTDGLAQLNMDRC